MSFWKKLFAPLGRKSYTIRLAVYVAAMVGVIGLQLVAGDPESVLPLLGLLVAAVADFMISYYSIRRWLDLSKAGMWASAGVFVAFRAGQLAIGHDSLTAISIELGFLAILAAWPSETRPEPARIVEPARTPRRITPSPAATGERG